MTSEEFVECCRREKQTMLAAFLDPGSGSEVAAKLAGLASNPDQHLALREAIDGILTDVFTTLLYALDGAASLGGRQGRYSLRHEQGEELTGNLEGLIFRAFHGPGRSE